MPDNNHDTDIRTPETHPSDQVVGHLWFGPEGLYYCDSYEPRIGFWMTDAFNASDRRNVSERAIHRTFHRAYPQWQIGDMTTTVPVYVVDLDCRPLKSRRLDIQGTHQTAWRQPVFADQHDADRFVRRTLSVARYAQPATPAAAT